MRMHLSLLFLSWASIFATAQNTVGLISYDTDNQAGYVLFSPMTSTKTYLIDKCGEKVHEWSTSVNRPALSCFLMQDGSLLRTGKLNNPNFAEGGSGGIIEKFDWDGNLTWSYSISDDDQVQHHDMKVLPNGNILTIVWDRYTNAQALAMGKNPSYTSPYLWSEKVVEIQPMGSNGGTIVWEWKVWDHLVQDLDNAKPNFGDVSDHPELININYFPGQAGSMDWIHLNSIDYDPTTDQILLSSHTLNEIWVIDHSTTTTEAASHSGGNAGRGGDLLYRWGNPQAYQRGNPTTKVFYGQHHATWIPQGYANAGKILVFNNGLNRPGSYSSIDMIETPIDGADQYPIGATSAFLPNELFWSYTDPVPSNFYSSNISGVYPLADGAFMVTAGASGIFFELNSTEQTVWKYINPVAQSGIVAQGAEPTNNVVFRSEFYPPSYPAFIGRNLVPLGEIELNPTVPSICDASPNALGSHDDEHELQLFPNPVIDLIHVQSELENLQVELYDHLGQLVFSQMSNATLDLSMLKPGMYLIRVSSEDRILKTAPVIKQ